MESIQLFGLEKSQFWTTEIALHHLKSIGEVDSKRSAERRLHTLGIWPEELNAETLLNELGQATLQKVLQSEIKNARAKRNLVLFLQLHTLPNGQISLHANDARGARYWLNFSQNNSSTTQAHLIKNKLEEFISNFDKELAIFPHGKIVEYLRAFNLTSVSLLSYPKPIIYSVTKQTKSSEIRSETLFHKIKSPHLERLENESIHIIREAFAESQNPAMLYSVGKDSGVMLHLARKAFYPAPPPFPLLHVDTRWKFREMYEFRDFMVNQSGMELKVYTNPEAIEKNISPFTHGSSLHTDITKTEGLKKALDLYQFDLVFGGARRDEEKSRAKERIFSFRSNTHRWDPKNQRPELWDLFNTKKNQDESIRVFPLSNWTELDIWQYIYQENIPVVPLYFSEHRPVVERDGMLMLVDDDRCEISDSDEVKNKQVRFRTLGCYPLTGAVESKANSIEEIILELIQTRSSERQGRKIDSDSVGSMEKKKQEGYF
jgi:sulfate adenylyltransferase subunit 2